ncbi:MAG TPA: hypothetical protein VKF60_16980 [Myxococcota bacterium]|nr:hypothetical protein [Myxococcota bacterium]
MRLGAGRALLALILCAACFGGGPAPVAATSAQPSNEEVEAFSTRIAAFYGALEEVPLDALVTYENKRLRECFASQGAFSDYFSALATEARELHFRDTTARKVRILEFNFDGPGQAGVDVAFTSVHQREIRFWSIGFMRHDTWKQTDGVWQIVPEKL